jgi:hypothetical protein
MLSSTVTIDVFDPPQRERTDCRRQVSPTGDRLATASNE